MKKKIQLLAVFFVLAFTFTVSAVAVEYGYYDVNFDGKIDFTDVYTSLKRCLSYEQDGGLLRVIKTLRVCANSEVVTFIVTDVDYDKEVATLCTEQTSATYSVPFSVLGLNKADAEFFKGGTANLTVPTSASFDVSQIYAAKLESSYPTLVVSNVEYIADRTVAVTVSIKRNVGMVGLQFQLKYDSNLLTYVSAKGETSSFYTSFSTEAGANPVKAVFANLSLKEVTEDISLATFTFNASENAESAVIRISAIEAYDSDINAVQCFAENCTVFFK